MKKLFYILISISALLFFACASAKPAEKENAEDLAENTEIEQPVINENLDINDSSEISEENQLSEDAVVVSEENPAVYSETESLENNESEEKTDSDETTDVLHQKLEEIEEPEIIDLEPPPEEEAKKNEEQAESEVIPEAEKDIEELPPVDIKLEDNSEKQEEVTSLENSDATSEISVQENDKNAVSNETENKEQSNNNEEVSTVEDEEEIAVVDEDDVQVMDGDDISEAEESADEQVIIPSRSVNIKKFEYVDVIYPGKGWIFMGLTDNSKDLTYNGRQIGTEDTKFSLQAKNSGTKILHFYKNDALTGNFIDDYVEVIISSEKGSSKTHIQAPDYKTPLPESAEEKLNKEKTVSSEENPATEKSTVSPEAEIKTSAEASSSVIKTTDTKVSKEPVIETETEPVEASASSEEMAIIDTNALLEDAQKAIENKEYEKAILKLNTFLEISTSNRDQALYLLGQTYEVPGDYQNIQEAINSYTTLITNYPASKYWDNSNKRIIYLKRFYLEGR